MLALAVIRSPNNTAWWFCAVMAYATGHLSGGQLNPAVSMALALAGSLPPLQAVANILAQVMANLTALLLQFS